MILHIYIRDGGDGFLYTAPPVPAYKSLAGQRSRFLVHDSCSSLRVISANNKRRHNSNHDTNSEVAPYLMVGEDQCICYDHVFSSSCIEHNYFGDVIWSKRFATTINRSA